MPFTDKYNIMQIVVRFERLTVKALWEHSGENSEF